ncbi:Cof-like hydrolase [Secundilactobacillus odoratitofui DSM 19909 = JCM 15043]|uniref:Cof-like hydrolase n=1 Tax=Secundilactobacillus odoratitofui DSM 19909 = JCM 15043 TaxID=1423776 RepID=A0A0R1LPD4_9LACO|nr:HAD-IIB family hydrolase [Secundilactobacillus odoratitofui]KRK97424.1 Cof-like hydrolase [Secundilactobacillus odoratitofui DSM 19909 = JCM 15043]
MIKMVAVDMDGTFLNDERTYDKQAFLTLFKRMKQNNVHFVAASGSQYQRLRHEFAEVADQMDYISQNGAIVHRGHDLQHIEAISDDQVHDVLQLLSQTFAPGEINQEVVAGLNATYVNQDMDPEALKIVKYYYRPVIGVTSLRQIAARAVKDQFTKLAISFTPGVDFDQASSRLAKLLPQKLSSETSGFNTDLVGSANANKRSGIRALQEHYQVADDELMTFGDNENDLSMLTMTPNSYAMKNAAAKIQNAAAHVTQFDNNHSGVLETLKMAL